MCAFQMVWISFKLWYFVYIFIVWNMHMGPSPPPKPIQSTILFISIFFDVIAHLQSIIIIKQLKYFNQK